MTLERCNCEHVRHPGAGLDDDYPDIPRNGHPYLNAYAGEAVMPWLGRVCDACAITCLSVADRVPFDRESYARSHGWTLEELDSWEQTYGVSAEEMALKRMHEREEWRVLAPWERAPETHMN